MDGQPREEEQGPGEQAAGSKERDPCFHHSCDGDSQTTLSRRVLPKEDAFCIAQAPDRFPHLLEIMARTSKLKLRYYK